jgi:hypothetical protein
MAGCSTSCTVCTRPELALGVLLGVLEREGELLELGVMLLLLLMLPLRLVLALAAALSVAVSLRV